MAGTKKIDGTVEISQDLKVGNSGDSYKIYLNGTELPTGGGGTPKYAHFVSLDTFIIMVISDNSVAFTYNTLNNWLINNGYDSAESTFKTITSGIESKFHEMQFPYGIYGSNIGIGLRSTVYTTEVIEDYVNFAKQTDSNVRIPDSSFKGDHIVPLQ